MADRLTAGQRLDEGQSLVSGNGSATLIVQGDGNVVVYEGDPAAMNALWATGTDTPNSWAIMQDDGNFVIYDPDGAPLWATETDTPNSWAIMQDDGNFVIYDPDGAPLWASGSQLS